MPKNVQKRKARPKRYMAKPGNDHDSGLWVDYDLLRKHQGRTPEIVRHSSNPATNSRYLELADLVLGNKSKKKLKGATEKP